MESKVIAFTQKPVKKPHNYTKDHCIDQINQWTEIYNYLEELIERTGNISYKLHWIKTRDYVGELLSSWVYRCNEIDK